VLNNAANLASSINYKPFAGVSSLTYGNGIAGSIGYDNQYRITSITAGTVMNLGYPTYDANGNITAINNVIDPTKNKSFTYDTLDRLQTANAAGIWGSLGWAYDGAGNRLTENLNNYTYTPNTNKLNSANGISFGYDNNGNTTTEGARQYIYNQNQRLIQVNNGATTAYYTYNGNGQRAKKVVNGISTVFHYSLNGQIIAESDSAGNITAEYIYLNGQPLAKIEGVNTYYYHNDHLGTPQKMTDASGTVVWAADYKPFGEATITVSTITNNLRFPGQYFDAETGTLYNYFRDYDPTTGRYKQADPIGLSGGINLYAYTSNNPLSFSDPVGLVPTGGTYGSPSGNVTNFFSPPYMPPQTPPNCSLTGMDKELTKMGSRTIITDVVGGRGLLGVAWSYVSQARPIRLFVNSRTQYMLEQDLWVMVINWRYTCKDKCGKEYPLTLRTMPGGDNDFWETTHMWMRNVTDIFQMNIATSQWQQVF
jgi:RHS repeat-associated protein